jgi:hypothetical protein
MTRFGAVVALALLVTAHPDVCPRAEDGSLAARTLETADQVYREQNWERAVELYAALAAENPSQGEFWYRLASAEYNLKRYDASIDHYERAVAVGYRVGVSLYNAACCHALLGQNERAIDTLERAIRSGLRDREELLRNDGDFAELRKTREFQTRILPAVTAGMSREDGWRMDLEYLTRRVDETHYDPWRHISREVWDGEVARISKAIPRMQDHEVVVAMMALTDRLGDGHTGLFPPDEGRYRFHDLPIEFYDFDDGLFVRSAVSDYRELVGCRVVRIGAVPTAEALERIVPVTPNDNPQGIRWQGMRRLRTMEILNVYGIAPSLDGVELTVTARDGREKRVTVQPSETAYTHAATTNEWVDMADPAGPEPLWRSQMERNFWFKHLQDEGLVYVGFHRVLNEDQETLDAFATRLFEYIDGNPVDVLVVDVRLNHGGNNFLARDFMLRIVGSEKINQHGHLFVITGRETFSACQNFCNWLERDANVMFVGEPTGSCPNFVGEGNRINLPWSGLRVNASSRMWQDSVSEDARIWTAPDIGTPVRSEDYRTHRDRAMEAILTYLETKGTATN